MLSVNVSCANFERASSDSIISCVRRRARVTSEAAETVFSSSVRSVFCLFRFRGGMFIGAGEEVLVRGGEM